MITEVNNKILERNVQINSMNVHYKSAGSGELAIIILHGWGIDSDKYAETAKSLIIQSKDFGLRTKIIIPDLPGFGKSAEPNENWNLDNYVDFVDKFAETVTRGRGFEMIKNILKNINLNNINAGIFSVNKEVNPPRKFVLIGHSFGGRIAIKYATRYPEKIEKLILTGAAGIKHPLTLRQRIIFIIAKLGKMLLSLPMINIFNKYARSFLYKAAKEKDYNAASPKMKEVMKNVIKENLFTKLNQIKTPTLLIWGKSDRSTPLSDGKIMHDKIEGSEMTVIDYANHSLPYQKPEEFAKAVLEFIKK